MTETYYRDAQVLARKAIGWRSEAVTERKRREALERDAATEARQRETWKALEHLSGKLAHPMWERVFAYVHLVGREQREPFTMDQAGEAMRGICRLILDAQESHATSQTFLQWKLTGGWNEIEQALHTGCIDDVKLWAELLMVMEPPPLTRAIMQAIWDCAPVEMGSDHHLEIHEGL
jgi:hypothetical protein